MKTVNGGLLIVLAFFILWIGVTGRFPRLIAAIGLVRGNAPETSPKSGESTSKTGSVPSTISPKVDALHAPVLDVWRDALKGLSTPELGTDVGP